MATNSEMSDVQQRSVIKFFVLQGKAPKDIHAELEATLGHGALSYSTVKKWAALFKHGRESVEDDPRCGGPSSAIHDGTVAEVEGLVMGNRRVSVAWLAAHVGISKGSIGTILHDRLGLSKVSARWVPKMLTPEQKATRVTTSQEVLDLMASDMDGFMARIVTQDETWVPHFDPETKEESKQWKHRDSPPPRKFKVTKSAGKVMVTVFWDAQGILLVDFLEQRRTINGDYYADLLSQLRTALLQKRRGMLTRGVFLLQDNAPAHKSRVAMKAAVDCGYELLPHPPYSPDLAPSDFHLFPNMKKFLRGRVFSGDDEVKEKVLEVLEDFESGFFRDGFLQLRKRLEKCIALRGDYVEK